LAGCGLNWPLAIRSTSLCIARSSGEVALRDSLQARAGLVSQTQSQATVPIPSGYILRGRHINRSDLGRPAVPPNHRHFAAAFGRSQHQSPGGPSTRQTPETPARHPSSQQSRNGPAAGTLGKRQESRAGPSHALTRSREPARLTAARTHLAAHPLATAPRQTPLEALHP